MTTLFGFRNDDMTTFFLVLENGGESRAIPLR